MVSSPVFLADDLGDPPVGGTVRVVGAEAAHAAVRRIRVGETLVVADGRGLGVRGPVVSVGRTEVLVEVAELLSAAERPRRFVVAQALAKGGRDELAVEMLTELGIDEVVPWQAARSVVRWSGDRVGRGLDRWRSSVREAAKQSRRLRVPAVAEPVDTRGLARLVSAADLAVVLHESAPEPLANLALPDSGAVLLVVGPEGGIDDNELRILAVAGGRPVSLGDGVLRASTAGVAALAGLLLRPAAPLQPHSSGALTTPSGDGSPKLARPDAK